MSSALTAVGVAKAFGGVRALVGVDLALRQGEILGLIGPNGSGKTTFVNVVSGFLSPDAGDVALAGRSIVHLAPHLIARAGLSRSFQNLRIFKRRTALNNVLLGQTRQARRLDLFLPFLTSHQRRLRDAALELLGRFELGDKAQDIAGSLSFGEQKRL
jgi:ABC-type branched-subunit amino acid transport system ATPase component